MLLPDGYLPIPPSPPQATPASATSHSEGQTQPATRTSKPSGSRSPPSPDETGIYQPSCSKFALTFVTLEHGGSRAIRPHIHKIVKMLLPVGHLPIQPTAQQVTPVSTTSPSEGQPQPAATTSNPPGYSRDAPPKPPSWMMGRACALRILAQHSKCYLQSCGDVGTHVMYYFRNTAG
ncbi:hypothetical protein OG21DRAFT_1115387 [Imleria badia]|nr:hypothetical protein OG21DRAFT_1115387 [Imleria badia]